MKYLLLLLSFSALSLPTPQSLFRNGSNKDIETDTVILDFKIEELKNEREIIPMTPDSLELEGNTKNLTELLFKKYYRVIINKNENERHTFYQAEYNDGTLKNDVISSFYEGRSFLRFLGSKKQVDITRDLFYSFITLLTMNSDAGINNFLKSTNKDYETNEQLIDQEKKELLETYAKYLETIKDDPTLKEDLISPLSPEDKEESGKVKEILARPFYKSSDNVTLRRIENEIFLFLNLEKTTAKFDNRFNRVLEFNFNEMSNNVSMRFHDYVLLNGQHEFPKFLIFEINRRQYRIEFIKFRQLSYRPKTLRKIVRSLRKAVSLVDNKETLNFRPDFLF